MLKRVISLACVLLLLHVAQALPLRAYAQTGGSGQAVDKVKTDVAKRVGKKSTVKLRDGSKLKGRIGQAGEDSFTLMDAKTGQTRTLAYADVTQVKGQGGLSLAAKIGIGIGIFVGVLAILYAAECGNDPFC